MPLKKLDYEFITGFDYFLKSKKNCSHNTATKYIVNFKKIVRIAYANQWIDRDPFFHWSASWKQKKREFLTHEELEAMLKQEFEFERLDTVDEPGKLSHPRRIKVSSVNQLLGFDLSVG